MTKVKVKAQALKSKLMEAIFEQAAYAALYPDSTVSKVKNTCRVAHYVVRLFVA